METKDKTVSIRACTNLLQYSNMVQIIFDINSELNNHYTYFMQIFVNQSLLYQSIFNMILAILYILFKFIIRNH
jgi:hypothetical protein